MTAARVKGNAVDLVWLELTSSVEMSANSGQHVLNCSTDESCQPAQALFAVPNTLFWALSTLTLVLQLLGSFHQ